MDIRDMTDSQYSPGLKYRYVRFALKAIHYSGRCLYRTLKYEPVQQPIRRYRQYVGLIVLLPHLRLNRDVDHIELFGCGSDGKGSTGSGTTTYTEEICEIYGMF